MRNILTLASVLSTLTTTTLGHGFVSGIVTDGVYTKGWQIGYWYDIVNKVPIPQSPGWYEEALDIGFIPPTEYQ